MAEIVFEGLKFDLHKLKDGRADLIQIKGGFLQAFFDNSKWWVRSQEKPQEYYQAGNELQEFIKRVVKF